MKLAQLAIVPLAVLFASGCTGRDGAGAVFAGGLLAGTLIAHASEHPEAPARYERADDRVYPVYPQAAPQPIYLVPRGDGTFVPAQIAEIASPPAAPRPPPPSPPSFDATRARHELAHVDLTKCRETGAPRGYGHAKVTFNPSGDISKVVIDEPAQMPAVAAKCIGDEIGRTTVPIFNGSLVTVGTTWFVP